MISLKKREKQTEVKKKIVIHRSSYRCREQYNNSNNMKRIVKTYRIIRTREETGNSNLLLVVLNIVLLSFDDA